MPAIADRSRYRRFERIKRLRFESSIPVPGYPNTNSTRSSCRFIDSITRGIAGPAERDWDSQSSGRALRHAEASWNAAIDNRPGWKCSFGYKAGLQVKGRAIGLES